MSSQKTNRKQTAAQKLNNFLRHPISETYPLDKESCGVLAALASYFYYNDTCNPTIEMICAYSRIGPTTVKNRLKLLESLALIFIKRHPNSRSRLHFTWNVPYVPDEEIYRKKSVDNTLLRKKSRSRDDPESRSRDDPDLEI